MEDQEKQNVQTTGDQVPARISGNSGIPAGFDDVDKDDFKMPRLAILQQMSEIVAAQKGKMGELANSVTKEIYGVEVEIIVLFCFKTRVQFEVGEGLVMLSLDNKIVTFGTGQYEQYSGMPIDEMVKQREEIGEPSCIEWQGKEPPQFGLVYNFPCIFAGGKIKNFPVCLSLRGTATKAAKDFISMARYTNEDMFARVYKVTTTNEKNEKGTFAVPSLELSRRCTDEEYEIAKGWFSELFKKRGKIEVDLAEEPLADSNVEQGNTEAEPEKFEE